MKFGKIASIEIQNRKFYINAVMNFLDGIYANNTMLDFGRYNRLRFVVGEILKRRIERAYPGTDGTLTVDFYLAESYFEVSVRDKGVPVWMELSHSSNMIDVSDEKAVQNYMLDILTDDFGIEKLGKDGQRVFMRMNILNKIVFQKPEPYPETEVLDTNISIKAVESYEDAIEAIRCIYSEYGYSYSYERLYYIDSFMEAIKNKEIMSFLAVNEHGQTAGHFALSFSDTFKNMPEISTVVTRKEFRGLGLFAKFIDHCMQIGEQYGFRAFMGQPVAFHPISQKAFIKSEFTATAVLLSYIGSEIESEYNKNNERMDLFASIKILDKTAHSVVYPPAELRPFVDKIFKNAGYSYEIGDGAAPSEHTTINVETNSYLKTTKILIYGAADDLEQILRDTIKDSIRGKNEMIELMISMNTPSCELAYEIAKKCDFKFSGLIPGSETADYIVMQILIGTDCHYDKLVTIGEYEDLKNDVISLNG